MQYLGKARESMALEHPDLYACAQEVMCELRTLRFPEGTEQPQWMFAQNFQGRAEELHDYLSAAIQLAECNRFVPAYAVLRSALEHTMLDVLLRAGPRYRLDLQPAQEPEHKEILERHEKDPDSSAFLTIIPGTGDRVTVVHKGALASYQGSDYSERVSIYWDLIQRHNPIAGRKDMLDRMLTSGFVNHDTKTIYAKDQRDIYYNFFEFTRLCAHLKDNLLMKQGDLRLLLVHHQFLSAFVHPTSWANRAVYGTAGNLTYGHLSDQSVHVRGELVLLYVIGLVNLILWAHLDQCRQHRCFRMEEYLGCFHLLEHARQQAAHIWLPGTRPTELDRTREADGRSFESRRALSETEYQPVTLAEVADTDIRIPPDQLARLEQWHHARIEITTGHQYLPPWLHEEQLEQQSDVKDV